MKRIIKKLFGNKKTFNVSFQEAMDLCELPIITFKNNNRKVNFMLDTGSNNSIISVETAKELKKEPSGDMNTILSISNEKLSGEGYTITFYYKDYKFTDVFFIADIGKVFERLKERTGVQVHGILGVDFFRKYNYVLDFDELKAYIKK